VCADVAEYVASAVRLGREAPDERPARHDARAALEASSVTDVAALTRWLEEIYAEGS
jgi:predicted O-linked N-acetylglucosamine transferase (SPINDLY family)